MQWGLRPPITTSIVLVSRNEWGIELSVKSLFGKNNRERMNQKVYRFS